MEIRHVTDENDGAVYVHVEDIAAVLRAMGQDYLEHIPAHAEAGEFLEAMLDRHADFALGQAADFFEKGKETNTDGAG